LQSVRALQAAPQIGLFPPRHRITNPKVVRPEHIATARAAESGLLPRAASDPHAKAAGDSLAKVRAVDGVRDQNLYAASDISAIAP
jgi:hypothetical protein